MNGGLNLLILRVGSMKKPKKIFECTNFGSQQGVSLYLILLFIILFNLFDLQFNY